MTERQLLQPERNDDFFESDEEDEVDEDTLNIYGFNDDLKVDDKIIIKNPTENQIYNFVERPKNLYSFELREAEDEFVYALHQKETASTIRNLTLTAILNKVYVAYEL